MTNAPGFSVIEGSAGTEVNVILRASDVGDRLHRLLAALLSNGRHRPWIVIAESSESFDRIRRTSEFDESAMAATADLRLATWFPIDELRTFAVSVDERGDGPPLSIEAAEPLHRNGWWEAEISTWAEVLQRSGEFESVSWELNEWFGWTQVFYATGEEGLEQVLDWDDVYTEPQRENLVTFAPVHLRLRGGSSDLRPSQMSALANLILSASPMDYARDVEWNHPSPVLPTEAERRRYIELSGVDLGWPPRERVRLRAAPDFEKLAYAMASGGVSDSTIGDTSMERPRPPE